MTELWVYLAQTPLLWLVLTLTIYQMADWVFKRSGSFPLLNLARIQEDSVRGFATGLAAHGIGTARAFEESEESGAFSGLAMGLNGIMTSFLVPLLASFIL